MSDLLMFRKTGIVGGGATDLDGISATALVGEELCWVTVSDVKSLYRLNATSGAAADGVNIVIPVVGTVGNKRWILQSDKGGALRTNLLTNSQWMACSGSTLENVRALPDATSTVVGTTVSSDLHLLSAGMLVKDAAGTPLVFEVITVAANSFTVDRAGGTNGQWYEVTPGYVAADTVGPDGWGKDTTLDVWRQHSDATYTKNGSFYGLKTTNAAADVTLQWPSTGYQNTEFLKRFAGRTVTLGVWAYATDASHVRLRIYDGASYYSSYHTGAAGWEWLELTVTISASLTYFLAGVYLSLDTKTAYFSQPMLVMGSSIGSGNFQPPPGERMLTAANIALTGYTATTSAADAIINLEAASSGMIGKGVKAVLVKAYGKDSAAGDGVGFDVQSASGVEDGISVDTQVNNIKIQQQGWVKCDTNGDIYFDHRGSGAAALTIDIKVIGIET
jgi:hypothetical protein